MRDAVKALSPTASLYLFCPAAPPPRGNRKGLFMALESFWVKRIRLMIKATLTTKGGKKKTANSLS